jgi:hypothetical protein
MPYEERRVNGYPPGKFPESVEMRTIPICLTVIVIGS